MILGILVLLTALSISAVAIYYSVSGLVAIFAAAALPIMIMGGVLEVGKLVTTVWLHRYWKVASWWLRYYLAIAVIVLMFITSMGIFGFLSKAHIEQTLAAEDSIARVESIDSELDRQQGIITRARSRITYAEDSDTGVDATIQIQIDKEQERIDSAYTRIEPAIAEQTAIIANVTALFQSELDRIDLELSKLQTYIDNDDIEKAQGMIGAKADGAYGPKTAKAFTDFQDAKKEERTEWVQKLQTAAESARVIAARTEIARLRSTAEQQIENSNTLINRLRTQLGNTTTADDVQGDIDAQQLRIADASAVIETLTEEKIELESEYRKLEAEVGPIKYLAEFVYGETSQDILEEAVRWVIITIIFVFDPLAVLLLIASQTTFDMRRKERLRLGLQEKLHDNETFDSVDAKDARPSHPAQGLNFRTSSQSVDYPNRAGNNAEPSGRDAGANDKRRDDSIRMVEERTKEVEDKEQNSQEYKDAKRLWKLEHPDLDIKGQKDAYIHGKLDMLPWEQPYVQNEEQTDNSIWRRIKENDKD